MTHTFFQTEEETAVHFGSWEHLKQAQSLSPRAELFQFSQQD